MVWLKKKYAGSAPGYTWEHDGDVLDVDEELAQELLERPGDEFSEGEPPAAADDAGDDGDDDTGDDSDTGEADDAETKKPRRTRRTKVSE